MAYRVEQASTKRAICKNTECKKAGIKIDKGELRLGSWVDYGEHQGWAWKHWGCVTPVQIGSLKTATEDDVSMLDGYEELPEDLQEKVKLALENGHVADEDWKGDLEQNRPGKKGFRSPAPKKPKKSKKGAEGEESGEENGNKSPSKPAPKKRGRAKKEDLEDDNAEEPAKKKAKATTRKGKKLENESDADMMAADQQAIVPGKATAKKGKKIAEKDAEPEEAMKAKTKAVPKKARGANKEAAADDVDTAAAAAPKKAKAGGQKGQKTSDKEGVEASEADVEPKKAAGRPRKAKVDDTGIQSPTSEHKDQPSKATKKIGVTKNAANTKKPIAKKADNKVSADVAEATAEGTAKVKKGRKKADDSKTKSS